MVALISSILLTIVLLIPFFWYLPRRKVGTPTSWGEAMLGSTYTFFLLFWIYGVVPHQWLTLADNEWGWRPDRAYVGPGRIFETILPFDLNYLVLRDLVAVIIYGIGLVGNVVLFNMWQNRGDKEKKKEQKALETARSEYGRPLLQESSS